MRHFLFLLLAITFVATLPAHAQKAHKTKIKTTKTTTKQPVLTFERTVCLGTCPVYLVSVFADGRVAYDGRQHVPVTGQKTFKLAPAVVSEMLQMAEKTHFAALEPRYSTGITDVPANIVAVRQPSGELKTVVVESGPPEALQAFLTYLRATFDPLAGLTNGR